jgi:hypothetical protein
LWVSVALGLVALDYAWVGPAGFQKRDGRLSPAASVLLAPYLLGARINAIAWTRGRSPFDHVADDVWLGRMPTAPISIAVGLRRSWISPASCRSILAAALRQPAGARSHAAGSRHVAHGGGGDRAAARGRPRARLLCAGCVAQRHGGRRLARRHGRARDAEAAFARVREARPQIVLGDAHRARIAAMEDRPRRLRKDERGGNDAASARLGAAVPPPAIVDVETL